MTDKLETVILLTGQTVKAVVQEIGFFYNNFLAKYENHKLVGKVTVGWNTIARP